MREKEEDEKEEEEEEEGGCINAETSRLETRAMAATCPSVVIREM